MIKRCLITMTLMMAMFFGGQTISSSQASAQDVWVYSADDVQSITLWMKR